MSTWRVGAASRPLARWVAGACAVLWCASGPTAWASPSQARPQGPIRLVFDRTEVADVLRALALKTRANLVFPAAAGKPITLNVTARTVDEALRFVTAAAELAYRQIGDTYVVATPQGLRAAVEPFGERARIPLKALAPADAVTLLTGALPYVTARPAGSHVLVIGAPEDVAQARALVEEQERERAAEPPVSESVPLRHAAPARMLAVLKTLFPSLKAETAGSSEGPGGTLAVLGAPAEVAAARDMVRELDTPGVAAGDEREDRVYKVRYSSAPALKEFLKQAAPNVTVHLSPEQYSPPMPGFRPLTGATLGGTTSGTGLGGGLGGGVSGAGTSGAARPMMFGPEEERKAKEGDRARALVLSGRRQDVEAAVALLEQVDTPPQQVMVDVKVVDTSPERAEEMGLKWSWEPFSLFERDPGTALDPDTGRPTASATRRPVIGRFSRAPIGVDAVLSLMVTRKEARVLASPRIQVTDNDDASFFVGDTVRSQIVTQGGISGTTVQIFEFPIGIVLLVRPRVNEGGEITLRVHPVVSTITAVDRETGIPQSSTREAETTVRVRDGETLVIGGLIREEMTKTVQEVPLLSKLPLIGELFRNRSTSQKNSEILVFITPRIVKS